MSIIELEEAIKPLSTQEKLQLIQDVLEMLKNEQAEDKRDRYFTRGGHYEVCTPLDDGRSAQQLDAFLKERLG